MLRAMSNRFITIALAIAIIACAGAHAARAATSQRIKDIAKIEGVRENQLVGFGLVTGLNGTGDGVDLTKNAVQNMLERFDIKVDLGGINVDNIAAVMVTAQMPAFVKPGDTVDVTVSSIGDADSLRGGTLLQTPLRGADGKVYAVAQGALSLGGYSEGQGGARSMKGFPTSGRITGGAIIERIIPTEIMQNNTIFINLNKPDFTNAARVQKVIDKKCATAEWRSQWGNCSATALDASSIKIVAPGVGDANLVTFVAFVETLSVDIDHVAKVVINEKTGTIVMGADVKIDPVQIAHGSLTVKVEPGYNVSQPSPFSRGGETVVTNEPDIEVEEPKVTFHKVSVGDIVKALNDMGVTPSDIIAILQAAKVEGALQAEIVTM